MGSALHALPTSALRSLAQALHAGRLKPPVTGTGLARVGLGHLPPVTASEIQGLLDGGVSPAGIAWGLERLVAERDRQQAAHRTELVWTGPEVPGAGSRDTSVVVRELIKGAERSVLVATYAIYRGAEVFKLLAGRMSVLPDLSVRMFVNVARPPGSQATDEQVLRNFAEKFVSEDWPARARLPEVFYDPRALSDVPGPKSALHAKCLVVDDRRAFVSSANFTEAAQQRNIEAGVLIDDRAFACALRDQFESLVSAGILRAAAGLSQQVPGNPRSGS
jgi:phosphatidylserine/phosphatidylglycerophosphate/cardiolipin synthase-like enzyme